MVGLIVISSLWTITMALEANIKRSKFLSLFRLVGLY